MPALRGSVAAVVAALCLAIPATAMAQSAGDDQYADPFNEQPAQNQPVGQPDDSGSGNGNDSSSQVADTTDSSSAATATTGTSDARLAYTGFDLPLLFVTGAVLLLAGFTVRRVLTGPHAAAR